MSGLEKQKTTQKTDNMPTVFILKKDWHSHRGKLYHAGTVFTKVKHNEFPIDPETPGSWYNFQAPKGVPLPYVSKAFGCVYIPKM